MVHGIPAPSEKLAEGDLISIDFGAIVDGWHGDSAITVAVGEVTRRPGAMSQACEASLWDGLGRGPGGRPAHRHLATPSRRRCARPGRTASWPATAGTASAREMHMDPHILNYGRPGKGPRLTPGMALAIEPMITLGSRETRELDDGWTVSTVDGSWAAHWEHTVAILDDGPWVLTAPDGGRSALAARGVQLSSVAA